MNSVGVDVNSITAFYAESYHIADNFNLEQELVVFSFFRLKINILKDTQNTLLLPYFDLFHSINTSSPHDWQQIPVA